MQIPLSKPDLNPDDLEQVLAVLRTPDLSQGPVLEAFEQRLFELHPGILKSLETEHITLFPKVRERLEKYKLKPTKTRRRSRRREAA